MGCFPADWNALPERSVCGVSFLWKVGAEAVGTRYVPGLKIQVLRCASSGEETSSSPGQLGA